MKRTILALALGLSTVGSIAHAGNGDIGSVGISALTEYQCSLLIKKDDTQQSIELTKTQSTPASKNIEGRAEQFEGSAEGFKAFVSIRQWVLNGQRYDEKIFVLKDSETGVSSQATGGGLSLSKGKDITTFLYCAPKAF